MTTQQEDNLISLLDAYVEKGGHHLNVNVFNKDTLLDEIFNQIDLPFTKEEIKKFIFVPGKIANIIK